jgi:hypothetical protein
MHFNTLYNLIPHYARKCLPYDSLILALHHNVLYQSLFTLAMHFDT